MNKFSVFLESIPTARKVSFSDEVCLELYDKDSYMRIDIPFAIVGAIVDLLTPFRQPDPVPIPFETSTHTAVLTEDHVECGGAS
jgi:hypothetical protein